MTVPSAVRRTVVRRGLVRRASGVAAACLLLGTIAPPLSGQAAVRQVEGEEIFRQTPGGKPLATVLQGTRLSTGERQGRWTSVTVDGWMRSASVGRTPREGFDLVVTAPGGEDLREGPGPDARTAARLLRGFLLQRVGESGDWVHVRRTGWIRTAALAEPSPAAPASGEAADAPAAGEGAAADTAPDLSTVAARGDPVVIRTGTAYLRAAPGGDTVATVEEGATVRVVERRGPWARVRLEAWAPASELVPPHPDSVADLDVSVLRANPDQYTGRRVHWTVRFISLERAEAARTDFYEGEPFILARAPRSSEGFVYLAVPEALLPQVRQLEPLQELEVLARVRTGRSTLMGVPVLELQAIY